MDDYKARVEKKLNTPTVGQIGLAIRTHYIDQYKVYDNFIWASSACKQFAGILSSYQTYQTPAPYNLPPTCMSCFKLAPYHPFPQEL